MTQGTEEEVSAEWRWDEAACLEVGAPEMPELSVPNDPLYSTIFLSMNLNGQILAFPCFYFCPQSYLQHSPINSKRNLIYSYVKYLFFPQTLD